MSSNRIDSPLDDRHRDTEVAEPFTINYTNFLWPAQQFAERIETKKVPTRYCCCIAAATAASQYSIQNWNDQMDQQMAIAIEIR